MNSALTFGQAEFSFDKKVHKFPKTPEGIELSHDYHFTNTGNDVLIIESIEVSCSCTQFTFPKEPIPPQGKGTIHVTFDTNGKIGYQDRILTIHSNAKNPPHKLRFRVVVDNKHPIKNKVE